MGASDIKKHLERNINIKSTKSDTCETGGYVGYEWALFDGFEYELSDYIYLPQGDDLSSFLIYCRRFNYTKFNGSGVAESAGTRLEPVKKTDMEKIEL